MLNLPQILGPVLWTYRSLLNNPDFSATFDSPEFVLYIDKL